MKKARLLEALAAGLIAAALAHPACGQGLLVPKDEGLPPLAVKYLRVDASIDNQAATTRVVQEFQNSTGRDLECTYVFPLPKGAAIRDFAMYIGGKRMKGELLEKDKARSVYEDIVRRAKDPGLLEYVDGQILRLRIFPVPAGGTQKVELEYAELLPVDGGLGEYVFPLRVGEKASRTLEDFTVAVRIKSASPIKSVYSPTHEVGVARPSEHEAVAGVETRKALLDRDFHLFWTLSEKDFGLALMTYRPDPSRPGMFLALISPKSVINDDRRTPRDAVFVLDTSGSMKGEKIEQARRALKFCLDKLDPKDRFAVVQFSTSAQALAEGWADASAENVEKARKWVDTFEAAGGTNIAEALQKTFALPCDDARPATVMFLTDGRPTVDFTDTEALLKIVKDSGRRSRMFTFGVGDDVSTHLLDRMAGETGGLPEYVRPGEAIDGKVTRLFSKMTHPVLTDLVLEVPGVRVTEMYPKRLPDLFRGGQIVIVGAYEGDGDSVLRLKGRVAGKAEELVYEGTFPKKTAEKSFIGPLYASRKIGFLLDQIRLHGENKELKDEVVRLSLEYGIETPYTSYLVLESEEQYKQFGVTRSGVLPYPSADRRGGAAGGAATSAQPWAAPQADGERHARAAERVQSLYKESGPAAAPAAPGFGMRLGPSAAEPPAPPARLYADAYGLRADEKDLRQAETGKTAIDIAQQIQRLRQSEQVAKAARKVQNRGGKTFVEYRGVWVDQAFEGTERLTRIKWGSEAFFRLAREKTELVGALGLGQRVVVITARGVGVAVDPDEGAEKLSDEELQGLFTDAPAK
ncbi:MAG: VWA domain-containing protein [Planctomycetes bacterium]|nr:VWA domain-containing protein [Planctomycetota bacterium]